jgi:probable rRNA maturation factor
VARFLTRASGAVGLKGPVAVLIASNRELRALNLRFRGRNQATDVLSFPAASTPSRAQCGAGTANAPQGDIAVSAEIAAANARRLGHSLADELKVLLLHGLLHLAGYDHETDGGEMERRETYLRNELGLLPTLIQRTRPQRSGKAPAKRRGAKRPSPTPARPQPSGVPKAAGASEDRPIVRRPR